MRRSVRSSARTFQAAAKEIEIWSGRQFDPQVVTAFLAMPESIWHALQKHINDPGGSLSAM
jgi:HD-GYP domain-containing protein (c-di-GMP phosphodiesterase class II)